MKLLSLLKIQGFSSVLFLGLLLFSAFLCTGSQTIPDEASAMLALKKSLNPPDTLGWFDPNYRKWKHVVCCENRVFRIQIGYQNLQGTLPPELSSMSQRERLEVQWNNISGPLPSLKGLSSLQVLMLSNNQFSFMPTDFFSGMSSLQSVEIDGNPFLAWKIPQSFRNASTLRNFSANSANITGTIPDFLGPDVFPGLTYLHLALNNLEGELPTGFSGSQIESLRVKGQKLSGKIDVI